MQENSPFQNSGGPLQERRSLQRFTVMLQARAFPIENGLEKAVFLKTCNISAGGAFIAPDSFPAGTRLKLDVFIQLSSSKARLGLIKVFGEVIRIEEKGMAVQFDKRYEISPLLRVLNRCSRKEVK